MVAFTEKSRIDRTLETESRVEISGAGGRKEGGKSGVWHGHGFSFWVVRMFWNWVVEMAASL